MTHRVYLDDAVIVQRPFDIPEKCPRCGHRFELGEVEFISKHLWAREEKLMLTTVQDGDVVRNVVSVKDYVPYAPQHPGRFMELRCHMCASLLASAHTRTWLLEALDQEYAYKLRGLLYDSNVSDPLVITKCFDGTRGYVGDCRACNIEAEIGTEEVPHPIDTRLHTCKKPDT